MKRKKQTELEENDSKDLETAQDNQATSNLTTSEDIEEETGRNKIDEQKVECSRH